MTKIFHTFANRLTSTELHRITISRNIHQLFRLNSEHVNFHQSQSLANCKRYDSKIISTEAPIQFRNAMYLQLKIDFHEFIFERKEKSFSFHCFVVYERNAIMWFGDDNTPTPIEQNFIRMQWRRSCCNFRRRNSYLESLALVSEWMRMGETMKVNFVPSSVLLCLSSFVLIDYYSGPYWHALGRWLRVGCEESIPILL